jgi:hypothetical protein
MVVWFGWFWAFVRHGLAVLLRLASASQVLESAACAIIPSFFVLFSYLFCSVGVFSFFLPFLPQVFFFLKQTLTQFFYATRLKADHFAPPLGRD